VGTCRGGWHSEGRPETCNGRAWQVALRVPLLRHSALWHTGTGSANPTPHAPLLHRTHTWLRRSRQSLRCFTMANCWSGSPAIGARWRRRSTCCGAWAKRRAAGGTLQTLRRRARHVCMPLGTTTARALWPGGRGDYLSSLSACQVSSCSKQLVGGAAAAAAVWQRPRAELRALMLINVCVELPSPCSCVHASTEGT
jgi:hypothetical protein